MNKMIRARKEGDKEIEELKKKMQMREEALAHVDKAIFHVEAALKTKSDFEEELIEIRQLLYRVKRDLEQALRLSKGFFSFIEKY